MKSIVGLLVCLIVFFALPSSGHSTTVVTFGTSITARGGWQGNLQKQFEICLGQRVGIQIVGGPGEGSRWGLANADKVLVARPDIIIIEFAINDADIRNFTTLAQSQRNTIALIDRFQKELPGSVVVLMTTPKTHGWKNFLRPRLAGYYQQYRKISREKDLFLIDVDHEWRELPLSKQKQAMLDGVHPDPMVLGQLVANRLRDVMKCR